MPSQWLTNHGLPLRTSYFVVENDVSRVPPLVCALQESLAQVAACDPADLFAVSVALHEALINAIVHGNLEIGSEGYGVWHGATALLRQRRRQPPYCHRRVHVVARESPLRAEYVIGDQGPGYAVRRVLEAIQGAPCGAVGRGLFFIGSLLDEVHWNDRGNEITLVKCLRINGGTPSYGPDGAPGGFWIG